jgi:predicted RNase H-like HicB family nuclease
MKTVHVRYHNEPEGWWAESEDLAGWSAAGDSFDDIRAMAKDGIREFAGADAVIIEEGIPAVAEPNNGFDHIEFTISSAAVLVNTSSRTAPEERRVKFAASVTAPTFGGALLVRARSTAGV